jgi:hypothetical protein
MIEHKRFYLFLTMISIAGSVAVWLATSAYGPGLSTDGARYLSTAESLAAGRGIIDYLGLPLVNWPPLYPLVLAGLHLLTGIDVFVLGQVVNIIAFGAIIALSGLLFERSLPSRNTFAYAATLVVATSLPLIEVSANIASDPLFIVTVLLFLLAAQRYIPGRARRQWWQMVVLAVAASFLRYAGLAVIICGGLVCLWAWRHSWRRALPEAAGFGLAAGLPIGLFAVLHNLPNGTLLGAHRGSDYLINFLFAFDKVVGWFVPSTAIQYLPGIAIFSAVVIALLLLSSAARRRGWLRQLQADAVMPNVIFTLVYGAMMVFTISTSEHEVLGSQRLHAVLLPSALVLLGVALQELLPAKIGSLQLRTALFVAFALWLIIPLFRVQAYVRTSLGEGEASFYNLYNTRTLRESDIVTYIQSPDFQPEGRLYSNNEAAAWFYLRERIYRLPRYDTEAGETLEAALLDFNGWPSTDENATLIWFERELDYKDMVPTPDEMQSFLRLTAIFTGRHGDVYLMDLE